MSMFEDDMSGSDKGRSSDKGAAGASLFIGNLPFNTTEEDLKNLLSEYGEVVHVSIPRDRETSKPRGFAFVEMSSSKEAQDAMAALNGSDFNGRDLRVNPSQPKTDKPRGGRSGGGGGYGGGRSGGGGGGYGGGRSGGGRGDFHDY